MPNYQIDQIDREIVKLLQSDGKMKIKEVAAHLGMTNTPVFDRIKRLEQEKVITGYSARADRMKLGFQLIAFTSVSFDKHKSELIQNFENDVRALPEVLECYHIAGMFDYLLKVLVRDMDEYQQFITKKLAGLQYIGQVQSSFVMTEIKKEQVFPV